MRASNTGAASADHGGRANSGINIEGLHIVLPSGRLLPVVLAAIILALVGGVASLSREGERIPPQAAAPSGQPSPSPSPSPALSPPSHRQAPAVPSPTAGVRLVLPPPPHRTPVAPPPARTPAPSPAPPRQAVPAPAAPERPDSRSVVIDRGHGNELNIKLAGFAPGAEVTVSVYTDTSASGGPAGQKSVSVNDDGTCEFGAFPMDAHGAYWVVADGVRSNSYQWAGK